MAASAVSPPPSRFFYGWVIVVVCFLAEFGGTLAGLYALTVILVPMSDELGWSRTAIVGANFIASITAAVSSPFLGRLVDRRGVRVPMAVAALGAGLATMAIATVHELWLYYLLFGAVIGLTRPMVQGIGVAVGVANWFVRRRSLVTAMVSMGIPAAGFVGIPLAQFMVLHFGWRSAWVVLGGAVVLLVALPTALFMRQRPEDMGLRPDGDVEALEGGTAGEARGGPARRSRWGVYRTAVEWEARDAVRTRAFWVLTLVPSVIALAGPAFATHVVAFFLSKGLSPGAAAGASTSFIAGTFVGRFFWGTVSSRLHIQYCYVLLGAIAFLGTSLILVAPTLEVAYPSVAFFGLSAGGLLQLRFQIWPDYFGREHISALRGYSGPFELIGMAFGPLFAAWMYDTTGSYDGALLLYAILSACGLLAMLALGAPPRHPSLGAGSAAAVAGRQRDAAAD